MAAGHRATRLRGTNAGSTEGGGVETEPKRYDVNSPITDDPATCPPTDSTEEKGGLSAEEIGGLCSLPHIRRKD